MVLKLTMTKNSVDVAANVVTEEYTMNYGHIFRGKSAYEYAVEGGYKGTEAQLYEDMAEIGDVVAEAKGAATEANTATTSAVNATKAAEASATVANNAAREARTARDEANTAAANANTAAEAVDDATEAANSAAAEATTAAEAAKPTFILYDNVALGDDMQKVVEAVYRGSNYILHNTPTSTQRYANGRLSFAINASGNAVLWALWNNDGEVARAEIEVSGSTSKVVSKQIVQLREGAFIIYGDTEIGQDVTDAFMSISKGAVLYMYIMDGAAGGYAPCSIEAESDKYYFVAILADNRYYVYLEMSSDGRFKISRCEKREVSGAPIIFERGRGTDSAVTGIGTEAKNKAEVAIGQHNVSSDNTLFSVGDGTSEDARRNAFEVRGARPLSATASRIDLDKEGDTTSVFNAQLSYVGKAIDYTDEGYSDVFIIYAATNNIGERVNVGVGERVAIKVSEWDADNPTCSSRIAWVRDERAEWDYFSKDVVVNRILNDAVVGGNIVATTPSGDPMHYAYELEGAVWQPEEMLWRLNGIDNLTTEEIRAIYAERFVGNNHSIMNNWWANSRQRTNMCRSNNGSASSITQAFISAVCLEAATLGTATFYSWKSVFQDCSALRSVVGELNWKYMTASSHIDANVFKGCTSLEEVRIKDLKQSVSFADSPRLSKESVLFMIQNASPTSAITITLDEGVRDACAEDSDIQDALSVKTLVTLGI